MTVQHILRLLSSVALLLGAASTAAVEPLPGCGYQARLEASPPPSTAAHPVTLAAAGEWYDSCTPSRLEIAVTGYEIEVVAILDYPPHTGCLTVITPWRLSQSIGCLAPGTYQAELYIRDARGSDRTGPCAKLEFVVRAAEHEVFLPLVRR